MFFFPDWTRSLEKVLFSFHLTRVFFRSVYERAMDVDHQAQVHRVGDEEQTGQPRQEPLGQGGHHPPPRQPVLVQVHVHGGDAQPCLG